MPRTAWRIGTYTMPVNPNVMSTPMNQVRMDPRTDGTAPYGHRAPTVPGELSFGGLLYGQAQYNALATWVATGGLTVIVDHLGRTFSVIPVRFEPEDRRSGLRKGLLRWKYTVTCLLMGQLGGGLG